MRISCYRTERISLKWPASYTISKDRLVSYIRSSGNELTS